MSRAQEAELMQYMVPGSTLDDLYSEDEDDDYSPVFDVRQTRNGTQQVVGASGANTQKGITSLDHFQPAQHKNADARVLQRIRVDDIYEGGSGGSIGSGGGGTGGAKMNQKVLNELRGMTMSNRFTTNQTSKEVDRSERATVENVIDPRTRLILYKLVNSGILKEVNGCVSTGKEANVYYAVAGDGTPAALKIYKTSILVFKDRDQYVSGEYRFQRYCKSNPRKMVRTWAEKEARNLSRLQEAGVLAPAVRLLRQHVLVMEFLGEDGWPAPRLKEVQFPSVAALDRCYLDLCCTMRKMFGRSRLIHGDLSEYNLLLYRGRVVVIDVSQSVEVDHPRAMDFLRRDIVNVNNFFRSRGLGRDLAFSHQVLYRFLTAPAASSGWQRCVGPDNADEILAHLKELREQCRREATDAGDALDNEQAHIDEQVFLNIAVPRRLNEVADHKAPNEEVAGFVAEMVAPARREGGDDDDDDDGDGDLLNSDEDEGDDAASGTDADDDDGDDEEGEEDAAEGRRRRKAEQPKTLAEMTKDEKKANRKAVKEANRAKREEKQKKKQAGKKTKKK